MAMADAINLKKVNVDAIHLKMANDLATNIMPEHTTISTRMRIASFRFAMILPSLSLCGVPPPPVF